MTGRRARASARRATAALVVGVIVGVVLASGGAAAALWTANATLTEQVRTGAVALSAGTVDGLQADYAGSTRSLTAPWTVTNSGTVQATYSTGGVLSSGSSTELARSIALVAWPVPAASDCIASATVGSGRVEGTWAAVPNMTGTLASKASVTWCLRTSIATSSPTGRVNPTLTVSLAAGSWTATPLDRRIVQNNTIAPAQTAVCRPDGEAYAWLDFDPSSRATATRYASYVGSTRVSTSEQTGDYPHFAFTRDTLPKDPFGDGPITVDIRVVVDGQPTDLMAVGTLRVVYDQYGTRNIQCP
ncbi:hypothetical protein [Frigoribacterium sp. Leaf186]|uniref:hypothetical protein n=1 Tax=Frigoribacterium sp. Leaf186 TaxID=1736293 RepID=UPI0006FC5156|nr:hypothetical protein [Frigoribacterium sp. Leaf186]KQS22572.1 hypothetical protein ASG05_03185 [Frigoribacterium sp. Leaf186]